MSASRSAIRSTDTGRAPGGPRRLALAALATLALVGGGWPGSAASGRPAVSSRPAAAADLPAVDPGTAGPDAVDELTYDLGDLAFQPEGFPSKVELKGKVYAPEVIAGRAPLVVLMHGRHSTCGSGQTADLAWPCPAALPEIPSYQGYDALGRNLASHGMVVVSIGANGINAADGFLEDGGASARAQLVLETLRRWKAWDASATDSPFADRFVGHIDLNDVGLMGHSRGGEGVVAAAQLNQRIGSPFGIKAVMALAPVDFDRRVLGGVPLGVLLPYCDGDVSDLQGASYYDDSRYASPGDPAPKATTLLYGANHNFFNTVWTTGPGSFDDTGFGPIEGQPSDAGPAIDACQPGGVARLAAPDQAQAGAVLMAGFLRRYLQDDTGLQRFVTGTAPFPASTGSARWSVAFHAPDRLDVERFDVADTIRQNRFGQIAEQQGMSSGLVCNAGQLHQVGFSARTAPASSTCEDRFGLSGTNDTGALDVGWVRPSAVVREPLDSAGTDVTGFDGIRFRVAVVDDSRNATRPKQDVSVVVEDADGNRASALAGAGTNAFRPVAPGNVRHAVLNGVRVPLSAFSGIDLTRVRAVELRFDRTNAGRLEISDLAFTQEGTGAAVGPTAGSPADPTVRPTCRRTPSARWGCALAQLAWGRDPTNSELAWLAAGYHSAATRRSTIARVVATRTMARLHELRFAERYLQAEVPGGDAGGYLSSAGRTWWDVGVVELTSGLAFGSPRVSSIEGIVVSAYQTFTGRSPDPAGLAYWRPRVEAKGPSALASSLAKTAAYRGRVADERYLQILGRAADPAGRAYWVAKLAARGGEQAMVRSLLDTESFRVAASS